MQQTLQFECPLEAPQSDAETEFVDALVAEPGIVSEDCEVLVDENLATARYRGSVNHRQSEEP